MDIFLNDHANTDIRYGYG